MRVVANGKPVECAEGEHLPSLLARLGLRPERVVVERNGEALTPAEAASTVLAEGDRLEIVRIVAGG